MSNSNENKIRKHFLSGKGQRIMLIGVIICVALCAVLFSITGIIMRKNMGAAVDYIGERTLREASYQITQRFEAVMEQRIQMVKGLAEDEEYGAADTAEQRARLAKSAEKRGFKYLSFIVINEDNIGDSEKGRTMDFIASNEFVVVDAVPFRTSVLNGQQKIAVGTGVIQGSTVREDIVLYSVPTKSHTMLDAYGNVITDENGTPVKSMALVAGFSNSDFIDMLNVNTDGIEDTIAYIIREDVLENGETNSFVLKPKADAKYASFSELLKNEYDKSDSATIIRELNESMHKNEVYSSIIHVENSHIHMYCNALEKSEWYLITLTNSTELTDAIGALNGQWIGVIVISVVTIIVMFIAIFLIYAYYSKKTLMQLDHAREAAINANKAKSDFLSNMSHDIRTPMNAIVGMTAIATANITDQQQVQDCLKKIMLSSKHLLGLINDVLDMSKIESGKMTLNLESISLREIMNGIATIVQPQIKIKQQKFDIYIHDILSENVYCDSVRLNQVLLNLLSNAIKFTPEQGTINVALRQENSPLGEHFVRNVIDVTDTGMGMTPEFMTKIFESFTREDNARVQKTEGTGLGMAITKYIVDAMHGTIEVDSELGKGSHFHIVLDLEKVEKTEEEMILPEWHMLVVDDDEQLCRTTIASLNEIGIVADWTLSGEEAVEKTVKSHGAGRKYDIILLDWKLPGIDGLETARRIRKNLGNEVPILLISAYDWSEIEHEAREAGISGFISKPLFKSTLYYGLRKYAQNGGETAEKIAEEKQSSNLAGKHILLAEDNDLNWEIAEILLQEVGIEVERAENGKICVEMFESSVPGSYDAILMDIRMPVMTGYEATEAIRALDRPDKDLPIIAMTADAFADDMKKCLDCGMNAHISKPIDMDLLKATLLKFINA